jgi:hypothetical protein
MTGRLKGLLLIFIVTLSARSLSQVIDSTSCTLTPRLSFYSNEKRAELLLHVPKVLVNKQLEINVIYAGKIEYGLKKDEKKEIIILPVDLSQIKTSANIEVVVQVASGGLAASFVKYTSRCRLIVLAHKTNEVKTDLYTGGLIVNGLPFFPFGFYCYSPVYPTLPEEEVVKGFNMISPYQKILPETLQERKSYMDRCGQLGMKVNYNLLSVSGGGGVGSVVKGLSDSQKRDLLINEVKYFMNHPALLAWYISDEPTGNKVSPATLENIYKVVKETDPWHPVSVVFMAPFLSSKKYASAVDIVMADPYPIPDLPASMVGEVTSSLKREFLGEKPVWIVPQAFGGGELWSREPSFQEIRSMTYQSVINGATGIQYFVRQGLNSFPKSVSAWSECGRMALEISELTPWLLSDEEPYPVMSFSRNIQATSKLHNGQLAVLVVNKINEPQKVEIKLSGIRNNRARVIFENRTVNVDGGMISDFLPAFGSQVYMIDLNTTKDKSIPWSANLIRDPGFEDITSTGVPASCYARPGKDRGATYFIDSREHAEGNHSLRIITPKDSNGVALSFFPVTINSGSSYILSVWAKTDPQQKIPEANKPGKLAGKEINARIPYVELSVGEFGKAGFIPVNEWKQFITYVTIPPDSVAHFKSNVILRMQGQGVAWFDMLQLIEDPLKR